MDRVLYESPFKQRKKINKHALIIKNVTSTLLSIKGDAAKPKNGPCQWRVLYFHFMSLLTFVLMLGLGFGACLSPGSNVCLVVDMAFGCALWNACTCNSEVSTFLRRTQKKLTQNSQSDFTYGQWFNLKLHRLQWGTCVCPGKRFLAFQGSDENPPSMGEIKNLIIEWNGNFNVL